MRNNEIPTWATVGATVLLEPGSYSRQTKFIECKISRVTKASVFIITPGGHERRFVPSTWNNDGDRMFEYGQRNSYGPSAYVWNPEAESVQWRKAQGIKRAKLDNMAQAAENLATAIRRQHGDEKITELTLVLYGTVNDYESSK